MRRSSFVSSSWIVLFSALILNQAACSSSDSGGGEAGRGGSSSGGGGASSQAGGPTAGHSNATGGAGAGNAGTSGGNNGGASGSAAGGGAGGALTAGSGGTTAAAGSTSSGGSGGSTPVVCTPGTGTMPVGASSVLDQKTCLTWTKDKSAMTMTNKQAFKYCDDLNQDGISDWRVPRPEELVTWPNIAATDTAYITGPIYIPSNSTPMDGCTGNSHSCNISEYNANSFACAWQGVAFLGWVACVSGTANAGTTKTEFSASTCAACTESTSSFKEQDCSAYQ